ncbi:hypothetical protein D9M73_97480 [compost metagenome]
MIAPRHIHDFLGKAVSALWGNDDLIGDEIIDKVRPRCTRIPKIADLDRCRALGKDADTAVLRIPLKVDGNVDLQIARPFCHRPVFTQLNVLECVEARPCAGDPSVLAAAAEAESRKLKPITIMLFQRLDQEVHGCMIEEVCGKIADPDLVACGTAKDGGGLGRSRYQISQVARGAGVELGIIHERQDGKGRRVGIARLDRPADPLQPVREVVPLAKLHPGKQSIGCEFHVRTQRGGLIESGNGFGMPSHGHQGLTALSVRKGIVGCEGKQMIQTRDHAVI